VNCFIAGTDTDVGKTFFTALLTRALRRAGFDTIALKPICCGPRDDVEQLAAAADHEYSADAINPVWLQSPSAPLVAARLENRAIDLAALAQWFADFRARRQSLLVEGAGGWLVPLTGTDTIADLAALLKLPVLVVVANRLGCLNHALLTVESIRARGLKCRGFVMNTIVAQDSDACRTNRQILEEASGLPVVFDLQPGQASLDLAVA